MLAELKQCFMEAYDDNQDGKIDIREVKFDAIHIRNAYVLQGTLDYWSNHTQRDAVTGGVDGFCLFRSKVQTCVHLVENRRDFTCLIITALLHWCFAFPLGSCYYFKKQLLYNYFNFWLLSFSRDSIATCARTHQLAQLLPMEENFLLLFRFDNPLDSSVEFMKVKTKEKSFQIGWLLGSAAASSSSLLTTLNCSLNSSASHLFVLTYTHTQIWREYDSDGSGFIEADELKVGHVVSILQLRHSSIQSILFVPSVFCHVTLVKTTFNCCVFLFVDFIFSIT